MVKALGGPAQPAIGFAIGFDRLVEIVSLGKESLEKKPVIFIAALGEEGIQNGYIWANELCMAGVPTEADFSGKSLKSLMKRADRMGALFVLMVGESELKEGRVVLRDMKTKEQHAFSVDKLIETITIFLNR